VPPIGRRLDPIGSDYIDGHFVKQESGKRGVVLVDDPHGKKVFPAAIATCACCGEVSEHMTNSGWGPICRPCSLDPSWDYCTHDATERVQRIQRDPRGFHVSPLSVDDELRVISRDYQRPVPRHQALLESIEIDWNTAPGPKHTVLSATAECLLKLNSLLAGASWGEQDGIDRAFDNLMEAWLESRARKRLVNGPLQRFTLGPGPQFMPINSAT
jgi:hypothetical protein